MRSLALFFNPVDTYTILATLFRRLQSVIILKKRSSKNRLGDYMRPVRSLMFAACGLFLMAGSASAEDARLVKMAKLGVQLAGHNYATYSMCHASAEKLNAFKEKSKARFPHAGGEFDALFASGQSEGTAYWAKAAAGLGGDEQARAAICPNALQDLQRSLALK
jgi:hypothetical protein